MNQEQILKQILFRSFDHLSSIAQALQKIQKEAKDEDEAFKQSATLSMVFRAINDIVHPGFPDAPKLFPEQNITEFIDGLRKAHKDAIEKKIFPPCKCDSCNESTSRDTDKAE
jgi:hypothetical protein